MFLLCLWGDTTPPSLHHECQSLSVSPFIPYGNGVWSTHTLSFRLFDTGLPVPSDSTIDTVSLRKGTFYVRTVDGSQLLSRPRGRRNDNTRHEDGPTCFANVSTHAPEETIRWRGVFEHTLGYILHVLSCVILTWRVNACLKIDYTYK